MDLAAHNVTVKAYGFNAVCTYASGLLDEFRWREQLQTLRNDYTAFCVGSSKTWFYKWFFKNDMLSGHEIDGVRKVMVEKLPRSKVKKHHIDSFLRDEYSVPDGCAELVSDARRVSRKQFLKNVSNGWL